MPLALRLACIAALAIGATLLCSCGGGSSGQSTTSAETPAVTPEQDSKPLPMKRLPGHPKIGLKPNPRSSSSESPKKRYGGYTRASAAAAERRRERHQRVAKVKLERKAGHAAPFLVSRGDNSIPTYGSEAPASVRGEAVDALSHYLEARAAENWSLACSLVSAQLAHQLVLLAGQSSKQESSCAEAYAKLSERVPAFERVDPLVHGLASLRVEDPHAFALFYGPGSQQFMIPMEVEGGAWKVTQIAALPWPIGSSGSPSP